MERTEKEGEYNKGVNQSKRVEKRKEERNSHEGRAAKREDRRQRGGGAGNSH